MNTSSYKFKLHKRVAEIDLQTVHLIILVVYDVRQHWIKIGHVEDTDKANVSYEPPQGRQYGNQDTEIWYHPRSSTRLISTLSGAADKMHKTVNTASLR